MRKTIWFLAAALLAMASSASMAGGGCLAGAYQYFNDNGQLVGEKTVGCNPNSAWGEQTANSVFRAGCGVSG